MLVDETLKLIGKRFKISVTGDLLELILKCLGYAPVGALKDACMQFSRFVYKGKLYHSREYKKVLKRNSFTIKYVDEMENVAYGFITKGL